MQIPDPLSAPQNHPSSQSVSSSWPMSGYQILLSRSRNKDRGGSRGGGQRFKLVQVKKLLSSQLYPMGITTKANHLKPSSVVYYKLEGNPSTSLSYDFLVPARGTVSISGFT